jgi:hypothetical protein
MAASKGVILEVISFISGTFRRGEREFARGDVWEDGDEPRTETKTKFSRLRVRATGQRRRGGIAKGTRRSAQYRHGRTRGLPSLPQVLAANGLPAIAPLAKGETVMLERKKLDGFYRELQVPSRIQANTHTPQVAEVDEDFKSELTQS